ncbi:ATP-dependent DNA helicase RecG [Bifidobacterium commune]|uniref:ATP-dependent DNA helicase RecG n=1 Tax=Bifidobacterium commune TaxID=1505727 RepID=A0A1C4H6R0_9BIFI|nr:ATP-dependent DNA helicase RecG [Bifidobacterium commune]MBB2955585.1 ATP-dependent DNA helicase RecG [Bifidobacterium commune]SCC80674.1 ATP-dependent DNA helicase RecG [Bifidobacterium commune]
MSDTVTLETSVSTLIANKRRVSALKGLGVVTVGDALTYYPFRVTEPVPLRAIREAKVGTPMAFAAVVRYVRVVSMGPRRGFRLEAVVEDQAFAASRQMQGTSCNLVFFSHKKQYVDWMSGRLHQGANVVLSGTPTAFNGQLQFTHPEVLTVMPEGANAFSQPRDEPGFLGEPGMAGTSNVPVPASAGVLSVDDGVGQAGVPPLQSGVSVGRDGTASALQQDSAVNALRFDASTVGEALRHVCRPRPVYHATSRISTEHIHESIVLMLDALQGNIPDVLPQDVVESKRLMHRSDAFAAIHNPQSTKSFHAALATLRYEEAFVSQISVLQKREAARKSQTFECRDSGLRKGFVESLPFDLTKGQQDVIATICTDMGQAYPMQRLLQGEVGSGKTVVALAAMLEAVGSGYQAVLVAPTQVLAEQHFETISKMVGDVDARGGKTSSKDDSCSIPVTLLTGGMKLAARRRALATAASGEPGIIVATHAAFSKMFQAPNLALAVIDEQHRFGVEQREVLREKSEKTPHLLVMTATPIPRTAAMTWFGDLDISWLTELPGGRKPIRTFIVPEANGNMMAQMFAHIRRRIDAGERAYVICPRIDTDEADAVVEASSASLGRRGGSARTSASAAQSADQDLENGFVAIDDFDEGNGDGTSAEPKLPLHAVEEIVHRLASLPQFAGVEFATLTGRDDEATKRKVMADFECGKTPILVATTVIEVGVDVPKASCITIFDADRYGLSQLHQLRGRVGRGGTDSWAFLVSRAEPGSIAEQRLNVIEGSLDGAEIAQADLELRGAGDVLGDAQSGGQSGLKLLRVVKDAKIIAEAREQAESLLKRDSELSGEVQLAGAVLDFTRGGESEILSN